MTTPIIYPPLQPGVLDAGVTYTFTILARNASVISIGTIPDGQFAVTALDSAGSVSNPPGDMAVRFSIRYLGHGVDRNFIGYGSYAWTIPFTVADNAGNTVTGSQPIVTRAWAEVGNGASTALTASATTWAANTFTLNAHGFAVGDRVGLAVVNNYGAPNTDYACYVITAVTTNTFTCTAIDGSTGQFPGLGTNSLFLNCTQIGTIQNDITSPAGLSGTRGTAVSFPITTTSPGTISAAGVPEGIGLQGTLLTGTPLAFGWYPVTLTAGTMQRLALFAIAPGTYDSLLTAPSIVNVGLNLSVAVPVLSPGLTGDTINWTISNAPGTITLTGISAVGVTISGSFASYGTFPIVVTATGGAVPLSKTVTFVVMAPPPQTPLYIPWLHSDLSLTDLQFDLRFRGVQSYYATGSPGTIALMESDSCNLAVLLFAPDPVQIETQVSDATTLWLTARTDADKAPVIDLQVSGGAGLTTVAGGQYYLLPLNLSTDAILDAINDLDEPADGTPAVLTLRAQLAVLRTNGQTARSQPFVLTITQRLADAGLPALNQY